MSTYKELVGTAVRNYTTDPDNPITGQVWYDSTNASFKYQEQNIGSAWARGGDLNTARSAANNFGTQTAGLMATGYDNTPDPDNSATELYNGTSWTTSPATVNQTRSSTGGFGTQTSALIFGGIDATSPIGIIGNTESWSGSAWTEVNDLNTVRRHLSGAGADNTSGLAFGGELNGSVRTNVTESWNGTSWTEVNDMNTSRKQLG